jgi:hypothetical protein
LVLMLFCHKRHARLSGRRGNQSQKCVRIYVPCCRRLGINASEANYDS